MWSHDSVLLLLVLVMVNGTDISVPLIDKLEAPLKAEIDITALNQQLQAIIKQEVQKSLPEVVKDVLNGVDVKLTEVQQNLTSEMENTVSACKHRKRGPAFSAVFKTPPVVRSLSSGEILKFDDVLLNHDGGYDPTTGYFTAPLSGIYLVTSTMRPYGNNLHCYLYHNDKKIGFFVGIGWNTGSLQIVLHVVKGDKLYIKHISGAAEAIQHEGASMFSVVYISE